MSDEKQTAVEWLGLYIKGITTLNCDDIIEKALEMEKQQIQDAYGLPRVYWDGDFLQMDEINAEQYYNKKFNKQTK
jgi:hypothetical protein